MTNIRKLTAVTLAVLLCTALAGCGCGKKKTDPASEQVLKISITPEPSPTPAPEEINPEAVVTNGDLTMVNGYLADGAASGDSGQASSAEQTNENDGGETTETDSQENAVEEQ